MTGPLLNLIPDDKWLRYLDDQHVESFYHNPRLYGWLKAHHLGWLGDLMAPRGFSRLDGADGPSAGDSVHLMQSVADAFAQVIDLWEAGKPVPLLLWLRANAAPHEHFHTRPDAQPLPAQLERWSHPNELAGGIQHAQRNRWPVNAFTGLLRSRKGLADPGFRDAAAWFRQQMAARNAP